MKKEWILAIVLLPQCCFCHKTGQGSSGNNHSPLVSLSAKLVSLNPVTYRFISVASDQDLDPLSYTWNFGEGTLKTGSASETFSYADLKEYRVSVTVSDGKSAAATASVLVKTKLVSVLLDDSRLYQVMEGFGGFGAQMEYWGSGPFTSARFVDDLVNDLGLTILRDNIPTNFELVNDNDDPYVTDLSAFNIQNNTPGHDGKLADHLPFLRDMKAAGLQKLIVSVWSPPTWMKYNNRVGNGSNENSAPPFTLTPDTTTNQLRTDMYEEFAEYCVAYIRIIKQETGLDVFALSLQNEPRFSQFYASCVYDGDALRNLVKVVGRRLHDEGLNVKLFLPEDVGWLQGIEGMVQPVLSDAESRQYVGRVAVHGYATDGIAAGSADAQAWNSMYNWGAAYQIPLWMTETSGYANTMDGALAMAKAMYIVMRYGQASAWLFWSLSGSGLDAYTLMSSSGEKSKRYYVSKNFYRYIRPGAQRFEASSSDEQVLLPLAFVNHSDSSFSLILINTGAEPLAVQLNGTGLPASVTSYITSGEDNCSNHGEQGSGELVLVPANAVVTLTHQP